MRTNKKGIPLATVSATKGIRARVDTNPDFQRPAVWSLQQKQLLIDSILREYDIHKMYWRKLSSNPDKFDVVDGNSACAQSGALSMVSSPCQVMTR